MPFVREWINGLRNEGLRPEQFLLAVCDEYSAGTAEGYFIGLYQNAGHPLLNRAVPNKNGEERHDLARSREYVWIGKRVRWWEGAPR